VRLSRCSESQNLSALVLNEPAGFSCAAIVLKSRADLLKARIGFHLMIVRASTAIMGARESSLALCGVSEDLGGVLE